MSSARRDAPPLQVGLDARLVSGLQGGVEQALQGLASGLGRLDDGREEYLFLVYSGQEEWLRPFLGPNSRLLSAPLPLRQKLRRAAERSTRSVARHALLSRLLPLAAPWAARVPRSPGLLERAGAEVIHLAQPDGFLTDRPTLYCPHDLQHRHFPRFFPPAARRIREARYRRLCRQARIVAALTEWGRLDLMDQFGLPSGRTAVIPWAATLDLLPEPSETERLETNEHLRLPAAFLLFPAQTWPHKNHLGLLEGLARLKRESGLAPAVVCPGRRNEHFARIEGRARELGLEGQVRFPGFIRGVELRVLYERCRGVIFPSRFEGFGLVLLEAFQSRRPVACSRAACLPEVAGGAALLFDPDSPAEIAEAARKLWSDGRLAAELTARGVKRAADFDWARTARRCRALYRALAGRSLSEEDRAFIAETGAELH